jgi:hypothetical protein
MNPRPTRKQELSERALDIEEVRLVSDLRIMHAAVDELYHLVQSLKQRHDEKDIVQYSDRRLLAQNIQHVDEVYLWYVKLKEETERQNGEL